MGTNYYVYYDRCSTCGRGEKELHIGKSSVGWVFSLHVIPEKDLNNLDDWKKFLYGKQIHNEYGDKIEFYELIDKITKRNHPKGLNRHNHNHCIGHGEGTWDLIEGEFS